MSLSGNLGFVSLDEVLRLLTRSKQRGAVDVRGEKVSGRIFVDRGGVGLATTFTDEALNRHLIKSGLVDAGQLQSVVSGGSDLGKVTDQDGGAMTALVREMSVESIYQLGLQGETFEVFEDQTSPYASPKPFELEDLLTDSKQRLTDWADVTTIVSDLDRNLRFRRDLGDRDQVTLDRDAWRVLSEVGQGSSVRKLADELGTTEFWTARIAAGLIEEDLLAIEQATIEAPTTPAWDDQPAPDAEPEDQPAWSAAAVAEADSEAEVDPNQSWWKEPEHEASDDEVTDAEPVAASAQTEWAQPDGATEAAAVEGQVATEATEVEEDTEAFLEKVFSDMEPTEEADEGYGLLRRRRMGVLRDTSNDS